MYATCRWIPLPCGKGATTFWGVKRRSFWNKLIGKVLGKHHAAGTGINYTNSHRAKFRPQYILAVAGRVHETLVRRRRGGCVGQVFAGVAIAHPTCLHAVKGILPVGISVSKVAPHKHV